MTAFIRTVFVACLAAGPIGALRGRTRPGRGGKQGPSLDFAISRLGISRSYLTKEFDEFTLPLGPVDEENRFTKSQHLEGKITRIVYVAPQGRTVLEVFRNYQGALKKGGFETLFTCGPQGCGSSIANAYANSGDNADYWGPEHGIHTFRRSWRGRRATFM